MKLAYFLMISPLQHKYDYPQVAVFLVIHTHENRILYEHLTNMLHVYKHINTQKSPTFDSNVHFFSLVSGL
jgi:hypothetical protein